MNTASGPNSTSLGNQNIASADGSIALGGLNNASGELAIAMGHANTASGYHSYAIGWENQTSVENTIALGNENVVSTYFSSALGMVNNVSGTFSSAVGYRNTASGNNSFAAGSRSQATANDSLALGSSALAQSTNGVAIGANSKATNENSVALGSNSWTDSIHTGSYTINGGAAAGVPVAANGVLSIGQAGQERQIQNVAAGVITATSTDAVNGSQLYAVGANVNSLGTSTAAALGGGSTYTAGVGISAPNYIVQNVSYNNVGSAIAAIQGGIAPANIYFSAQGNGVLDGAEASGIYSTASGGGSTASGDNSTAIGAGSTSSGIGSTALGYNSTASGQNSVAIGQGVSATRDNQVALGGASNTLTVAGINSAASRAAQTGVTKFVTTDSNGNLANSAYGPQDIGSLNNSGASLNNAVGILGANVSSLSNRVDGNQRESRQGIEMAASMGQAPMPSAAGKTTWKFNNGIYKNYAAT